jgi:hypothetical protein
MMTRLGFATALGQGHLPLLAPPFEADGGGGAAFRVKFKNGDGAAAKTLELNPTEDSSPENKHSARDKGPPMDPPEPERLVASVGGGLSTNTREAIEAAPAQLRSALILGSPEFMVR